MLGPWHRFATLALVQWSSEGHNFQRITTALAYASLPTTTSLPLSNSLVIFFNTTMSDPTTPGGTQDEPRKGPTNTLLDAGGSTGQTTVQPLDADSSTTTAQSLDANGSTMVQPLEAERPTTQTTAQPLDAGGSITTTQPLDAERPTTQTMAQPLDADGPTTQTTVQQHGADEPMMQTPEVSLDADARIPTWDTYRKHNINNLYLLGLASSGASFPAMRRITEKGWQRLIGPEPEGALRPKGALLKNRFVFRKIHRARQQFCETLSSCFNSRVENDRALAQQMFKEPGRAGGTGSSDAWQNGILQMGCYEKFVYVRTTEVDDLDLLSTLNLPPSGSIGKVPFTIKPLLEIVNNWKKIMTGFTENTQLHTYFNKDGRGIAGSGSSNDMVTGPSSSSGVRRPSTGANATKMLEGKADHHPLLDDLELVVADEEENAVVKSLVVHTTIKGVDERIALLEKNFGQVALGFIGILLVSCLLLPLDFSLD